ncbi:MAG: SDR family NAD(P)-dependent oxidoreductase, partial [Planctomycetota bacterium]|nr:SDR family NAD(P)-dependent oxidoreductase [Planctomycetota bacterium]
MKNSRPKGTVVYQNSGRVVLVSGGASGIGRAICTEFAASGADVVCLDINADAAADLPDGISFVAGDTANEDDCRNAVEFAIHIFGALDVLVNNAAIQPPSSYKPIHEFPAELWDRMVGINFTGYSLLAKHALIQMLKQDSGVIVNIASGQAHRTTRGVGCYGPLKAANLLQTRQWGVEYA